MHPDAISLFRKRFVHRDNVYAVMCWHARQKRDNYYDRVFGPLTDDVLTAHLQGEMTIAVFPTDIPTQTVKFCCWDVDSELEVDLLKVLAVCDRLNLSRVLERSGRGNRWHVWHFFDQPQPVREVRKLAASCSLDGIDFFPERDLVLDDFYYELPIKIPCGWHRKDHVWSSFVNADGHEIGIEDALTRVSN